MKQHIPSGKREYSRDEDLWMLEMRVFGSIKFQFAERFRGEIWTPFGNNLA